MIDLTEVIRERLASMRFDYLDSPYQEMSDIEAKVSELRHRYNYLFDSIAARKKEMEELEELLKELEG